MAHTLVVPAPAKVNLFLHVVGRRASDGYHLLESAMVFLRFGDTVSLTVREDGRIVRECDVPGVPEEVDLSVRAARALRARVPGKHGVSIRLEKRIPSGAGLGGGSSDAASVLLALNKLWGCGLRRQALMEIGLQLGADVPFFIFGRAAMARGIGERLAPISVPTAQIHLAKPADHVPTPLIFAQTDLARDTPPLAVDALSLHAGRNDLQPIAERLYPNIARVRLGLGEAARMSGSGAAVFTFGPGVAQSNDARWAITTRLETRHPLRSFADD